MNTNTVAVIGYPDKLNYQRLHVQWSSSSSGSDRPSNKRQQ
ncbi:MAG: hypothetical protein AAFQ41_06110 [Cyanobacteria bacterium J06623_7]